MTLAILEKLDSVLGSLDHRMTICLGDEFKGKVDLNNIEFIMGNDMKFTFWI
jgi:hypothetical protein